MDLKRSEARYWAFRHQTEAEGGNPVEGAPDGFREWAEALEGFVSWETFAKAWDFNDELEIELRTFTVWEEWNATLRRVATPLDQLGSEIVTIGTEGDI